jgi:hypothetical protein
MGLQAMLDFVDQRDAAGLGGFALQCECEKPPRPEPGPPQRDLSIMERNSALTDIYAPDVEARPIVLLRRNAVCLCELLSFGSRRCEQWNGVSRDG